jgi:zinc protease
LQELLTEELADWVPRPAPPPAPLPELPAPKAETIGIDRDTEQVNMYVGHAGIRRSDPDYYALLVMDYVFGMSPGFTDRLSRTLRDRDGLAYNVYGSATLTASTEPGTFFAYIGTSARQRDEAEAGIVREIRRIRDELVTPQELADSKAYLTGSFVFRYETAEQIAGNLVYLYRHGLGFDYPARFAERIAAVTREDVRRAARQHIHPEHLIRVFVGPQR